MNILSNDYLKNINKKTFLKIYTMITSLTTLAGLLAVEVYGIGIILTILSIVLTKQLNSSMIIDHAKYYEKIKRDFYTSGDINVDNKIIKEYNIKKYFYIALLAPLSFIYGIMFSKINYVYNLENLYRTIILIIPSPIFYAAIVTKYNELNIKKEALIQLEELTKNRNEYLESKKERTLSNKNIKSKSKTKQEQIEMLKQMKNDLTNNNKQKEKSKPKTRTKKKEDK